MDNLRYVNVAALYHILCPIEEQMLPNLQGSADVVNLIVRSRLLGFCTGNDCEDTGQLVTLFDEYKHRTTIASSQQAPRHCSRFNR